MSFEISIISEVIGIDQNKHRNPNTTWWNTYLVRLVFKIIFKILAPYKICKLQIVLLIVTNFGLNQKSYHFNEQLLPALHEYGNVTEFYEKLGWTEDELQAEIMFTEETLQEKIQSTKITTIQSVFFLIFKGILR